MDIESNKNSLNNKDFSKIIFIFNAIEDGWTVKKKGDKYFFSKQKSKEKRVYNDKFLEEFVNKYFNL